MKIADAKSIYYGNQKVLLEQKRTLQKQKEAAEEKYRITGDEGFSKEAASLELSLQETEEAYKENQGVLDSIMEQWAAGVNMESAKQQGEAMGEMAAEMGKIMTVFRRLAHGDIVPQTDERKLMEYDDKMYQMAKNMQVMAQRMEKERESHKSLWEDEGETSEERTDPMEVADEMEFSGDLPEIDIPDVSGDATPSIDVTV